MTVVFDGRFIPEKEFKISHADRGLQYGDGIFETIIFQKESPLFLEYHLDRLKHGMQVLSLHPPKWLTLESLRTMIKELVHRRGMDKSRIKLMVWRRTGGLYTPTEHSVHLLITAQVFKPPGRFITSADFSQRAYTRKSATSTFKTISALPYVLAGIEKTQRGLDELILLNDQEQVAECSYSNIFWVKGDIIFTPSLESGCIAGIRRRRIIELLATDHPVIESQIGPAELLLADQVFTCNVAGISWFKRIRDRTFSLEQVDGIETKFGLSG